jgi:hypothetical protein
VQSAPSRFRFFVQRFCQIDAFKTPDPISV